MKGRKNSETEEKTSIRLWRLDVANGSAELLAVAGPNDQQTSRRRCKGRSSVQEGQGASQEQPGTSLASICSCYSSALVGFLGRGKEVEVSGEVARKK